MNDEDAVIMSPGEDIEKIVDLIIEDNFFEIKDILNSEKPNNDLEYINLWYKYTILKKEYSSYIKHTRLPSIDVSLDSIKRTVKIKKYLLSFVEKKFNEKIKNLSFLPRIEKYLESNFSSEEIVLNRNLFFSFLSMIFQDCLGYEKTLVKQKSDDLPLIFLTNITEEHPFFRDEVLLFRKSSYNENEFYGKEVVFKSAIFKVFAGLSLTGEDVATIWTSNVLDFFELKDSQLQDKLDEYNATREPTLDEIEDNFRNINFDRITNSLDETIEVLEENLKEKSDNVYDINAYTNYDDRDYNNYEPYDSDLEYLYDEYMYLVKLKELQEEKEKDIFSEKYDENRIIALQNEIKIRKTEKFIRLKKTRDTKFLPRIEVLSERLNLNDFEKKCVLALTISKIFIDKDDLKSQERITIGMLLLAFAENQIEIAKARNFFYKNSKLIKYNLINIETTDSNIIKNDLSQCVVNIDNGLVEYLTGGDYNISNFIDGTSLTISNITMDKVILPNSIKENLLETVRSFSDSLELNDRLEFTDITKNGNSFLMLFKGIAGTGKTMLAKALSNFLDKKILIFNTNKSFEYEKMSEEVLPFLFKEAKIHDAILFFNEAEVLLNSKTNKLLIELQKHEGIVIFASDKEFKVNKVITNRLNYVLKFEKPDARLRKEIWNSHLQKNVKLSKDVDINHLSKNFELTGGEIKSCILKALENSIKKGNKENIILTMENIVNACNEMIS